MDWMMSFQKVLDYIEEHLDQEIDYDNIAKLTGYSIYHFQRMFLMMAQVSLSEYIRNRRLSKAAEELQRGGIKVIDVALKYQYSTPGAFQRAFLAMHGISPKDVKKDGVSVKAYPPISFELHIKGGTMMDYRIEEKEAIRTMGYQLTIDSLNQESYAQIAAFWADVFQSGKQQMLIQAANQMPQALLGISDYQPDLHTSGFDYYIACPSDLPLQDDMVEFIIPASTWAVFSYQGSEMDGLAKLQQEAVMEWLPASGYEFGHAPDIEVYAQNNQMEIWLPIIK